MFATLLALAISTCLSACGPSTAPLMLELRTADTHLPVANAAVAADSLALGPSLQASDIVDELMGRRVAFSSRGRTDSRGRVVLEHIPDRQVRLTFLRVGAAPAFAIVQSEGVWQSPTGSPSGSPSIEFMCFTSRELLPASR